MTESQQITDAWETIRFCSRREAHVSAQISNYMNLVDDVFEKGSGLIQGLVSDLKSPSTESRSFTCLGRRINVRASRVIADGDGKKGLAALIEFAVEQQDKETVVFSHILYPDGEVNIHFPSDIMNYVNEVTIDQIMALVVSGSIPKV